MWAALLPSKAASPNLVVCFLRMCLDIPPLQPLTVQALTTLIGAGALRCCCAERGFSACGGPRAKAQHHHEPQQPLQLHP